MRSFAPLWAALLVTSAILAGCAADPAPATDPVPEAAVPRVRLAAPTNVTFALPVDLGTVQGGAEPSVAIAPDGTIYVTTPLSLWRSDDGGSTYTWIGTPTCPVGALPICPGLEENTPGMQGGGDADLYVAPDGRVHWLGLFAPDAPIPYQVSEDKGVTWSDVVDLSNINSTDREWITGRADGTLFANWRNFPSEAEGGEAMIVMRASYDGGKTWTSQTDIAEDTRQGGIAVDPSSNALALAYDLNGPIHVARSFDDGLTWDETLVVDDPRLGHVFPVTAYDSNGTLYLAYSHDGSEDVVADTAGRPLEHPAVFLAASHDKGATWSPSVQVSPPGATAWFPWIAAGSAGRVVVTWYQNDEGYPRQVGGNVYVMAAISLDADFPEPRFTVVRAAPDPIHTGPECRETPGVCTRSLLDFFEVAIHPDGYAVLAWAKDTYQVPRDTVVAGRMATGPNLWG
ncbi:MAG: sialidase family protein [Candidatus Thermoplasmatota archaeon]|jgi:hypothetical protein